MAANRQKLDCTIGVTAPRHYTANATRIHEAMIGLSLSAMMVSDLDGHIMDVNPAFLHLWGYDSRADILGRRLLDLVLNRSEAESMLAQTVLRGSWHGEHIVVRKNGTLRVVQCEARIVNDIHGLPLCLASSFLDVTEHAEVHQSLRTSEARYRNIVDAVPVGIVLTNSQGAITFYSAQARAIFGLADDQAALGANVCDWIAPSQPDALPPLAAKVMISSPFELRLLRADGSEFWGEATTVPLDDDNNPGAMQRGMLIVVNNISDRKRAEEALAHYAHDLERSNQELEQFAYVASHDLQEPLRMVASYIQLLAKDYTGQFSAEADEYIDFAVDGAKRMQRLIDDLLAYSRVGTRGQVFQSVACDDVLRDVLSSLKLAIEESGAVVSAEPLPTVLGDRGQLYQLLQNLLVNALKFRTAAPPTIHISACRQPHPQRAFPNQALWQFAVSDNGIGIEPHYHERIFVIFQRLHSRAHYSGTGIGLAICKKIVERHGGHIWVDSALGQGTTFFFTLPGALAEQPAA